MLKKTIVSWLIILGMLFSIPVYAKTDIRTIGDSKKGERIMIVNKTGSGIQAFYTASEKEDTFEADLLENERSIKRNESCYMYFEADASLTYDAKIQIRNIEYVLHDFPIGDAQTIEVYLDDSEGIAYIEYQSIETQEIINTYNIEAQLLKEELGETEYDETQIYDPYGNSSTEEVSEPLAEEKTEIDEQQEQTQSQENTSGLYEPPVYDDSYYNDIYGYYAE